MSEEERIAEGGAESIRETIQEVLRICREENILTDYLSKHEQEAVSIMMRQLEEEHIRQAYEEKMAEGIQEGM